MKNKIIICLALSAILLFGCHRDEYRADAYVPKEEYEIKEKKEDTAAAASDGYVFSYNGTDIMMDAEADPVIAALGEYENYFESPSCAGQGIGKLYGYKDFEVQTYPEDGRDLILYVRLTSDMVSTSEGIDLSATVDKVKEAYGEPSEENDSTLIYEKGGMKLKFIFDGDTMLSIEYDSPKA